MSTPTLAQKPLDIVDVPEPMAHRFLSDDNTPEASLIDATSAAAFLVSFPEDHASLEWWLSPGTVKLLRIVRDEPQLWRTICICSQQAYLGQKNLEAYLDGLATLHGIPVHSKSESVSPRTQPSDTPDWQYALLVTGKDQHPKTCLGNMQLLLRHHPILAQPYWWDSFRNRAMCGTEPVSARHIDTVQMGLHELKMAVTNRHMIEDALSAHCRETPRDSLREWVETLPSWDGQARLDTYLCDWLGALNTPTEQAIGRLLIFALLDRALNPGALVRSVVILVGPEELGKSSFLSWMGQPFYTEISASLDTKEAHMQIQGSWLVELSELAAVARTGGERLKSFLTMRHDDYVPKYANMPVSYPRRSVFVGTLNPSSRNPLQGESGNTRFVPVQCAGPWREPPQDDRLQLFAEALAAYTSLTTPWWHMPQTVVEEIIEAREALRERSIYEERLAAWLTSEMAPDGWKYLAHTQRRLLTWETIAVHCLHLDTLERWKDKSLQMQISQGMHALGYIRGRRRREPGIGTLCYPWELVSPPF